MAGREPAAQAPRRDLRVGRLRRLLPRAVAQRRHLQHLRAELVRHAGQDRAIRSGQQGHRSRMNGDWVSGPETLTAEQMGANRYDLGKAYFAHPLHDDFYEAMLPDWSRVKVPLLSAANWGGQPLHPRGNFEGFFREIGRAHV